MPSYVQSHKMLTSYTIQQHAFRVLTCYEGAGIFFQCMISSRHSARTNEVDLRFNVHSTFCFIVSFKFVYYKKWKQV